MDNEVLVIKKTDLTELIEQLKLFNENIKKINTSSDEVVFFTRKEAKEHYKMSEREVTKVYTKLLKNKIVDIGKEQRIAKEHIDNLFKQGVVLK